MDRRRFLELASGAGAALLAGCGGGGGETGSPGATPPPSAPDWRGLAATLKGTMVLPADAAYALAAVGTNRRFDTVRPQAVARCASAADVQKALAFARANGVAVVPRCGGHSYGGYSNTTGLVIDVTPMNAIQVDAGGTATIGAGARLADVYDQLTARGVAIPSGSCPSVGIAGITQGGGIGVVDRQYGLTCDNLLSARVVTADGRVLDCDETHEPDLFWALRGGGGGNFGIVTSFTFRTHATRDLTEFSAGFRYQDLPAVLAAWQAWPQGLPDSIWSFLVLSFFNPVADPSISVYGVCVGDAAELAPHWSAFLAAAQATPVQQSVNTRPYRDVVLSGCAGLTVSQCHLPGQTPDARLQRYYFAATSDIYEQPMPDAGIQSLVQGIQAARNGGVPGQILLDFLGGAVGRVPVDATAFPHRRALFSAQYYQDASPGTPLDWHHGMRARMQPWTSGGAYVNYIDPLIEDGGSAYYGTNHARLVQVKAAYDPEGVFRFAQGIPPR